MSLMKGRWLLMTRWTLLKLLVWKERLFPGLQWMTKGSGRVRVGACCGDQGRRSYSPAWLRSNVMLKGGHCEQLV